MWDYKYTEAHFKMRILITGYVGENEWEIYFSNAKNIALLESWKPYKNEK